jgi:hypothetical protein
VTLLAAHMLLLANGMGQQGCWHVRSKKCVILQPTQACVCLLARAKRQQGCRRPHLRGPQLVSWRTPSRVLQTCCTYIVSALSQEVTGLD